jgi:hypothetical protein
MEQKTRDHIDCALQNHEFADWLSRTYTAHLPVKWNEWAVVAAFYSAVHILNAYIWEIHQIEPASHRQRSRILASDVVLTFVRSDYRMLEELGWHARYDPTYQVSPERLRHALDRLESILRTVMSHLREHE